MILRPVDETGDILPALSSAALLRGTEAVALLVRDRLGLLTGEWWENPAWGNGILAMLQETRFTETDSRALAAYLSAYIRETPGVQEVRDVTFTTEGSQFRFSCVIDTEAGEAAIHYEI